MNSMESSRTGNAVTRQTWWDAPYNHAELCQLMGRAEINCIVQSFHIPFISRSVVEETGILFKALPQHFYFFSFLREVTLSAESATWLRLQGLAVALSPDRNILAFTDTASAALPTRNFAHLRGKVTLSHLTCTVLMSHLWGRLAFGFNLEWPLEEGFWPLF